jgi:hypothetical protein
VMSAKASARTNTPRITGFRIVSLPHSRVVDQETPRGSPVFRPLRAARFKIS